MCSFDPGADFDPASNLSSKTASYPAEPQLLEPGSRADPKPLVLGLRAVWDGLAPLAAVVLVEPAPRAAPAADMVDTVSRGAADKKAAWGQVQVGLGGRSEPGRTELRKHRSPSMLETNRGVIYVAETDTWHGWRRVRVVCDDVMDCNMELM